MASTPLPAADDQTIQLRRLLAESDKFVAEQRKLTAEAAKFDTERRLAVFLAIGSAITASGAFVGAAVGAFIALAKYLGH